MKMKNMKWIVYNILYCLGVILTVLVVAYLNIDLALCDELEGLVYDQGFHVLWDRTATGYPIGIPGAEGADMETMNIVIERLENYIREYIHVYAPGWNRLPDFSESGFWKHFERQTGYIFRFLTDGVITNGDELQQFIVFIQHNSKSAIMIKYSSIGNYIPTTFHAYIGWDPISPDTVLPIPRAESAILSQIPRIKFYTLQANLFNP